MLQSYEKGTQIYTLTHIYIYIYIYIHIHTHTYFAITEFKI